MGTSTPLRQRFAGAPVKAFAAGGEVVLDGLDMRGAQTFRHEVQEAFAGQFLRGVTEDVFDGRVGEVDFALDVHEDDGIGAGFPEKAVTEFVFEQGAFGLALAGADGGFAQFAFDDRGQAAEVAFHEVIVGAGFHGRHRHILADAAGDDDEGDVQAGFLEQLQGAHGVERREVVVGQDYVPGMFQEGGSHGVAGFDPAHLDFITSFAEQVDHDLRVKFGIFNNEDAKEGLHRGSGLAGAGARVVLGKQRVFARHHGRTCAARATACTGTN